MSATILIADDYDDNRELLRLLLVGADYQVREAANGKDCVAMALEERPDLIMVDLSMPGMDGWEVLRELRADERTASVPCVAVTAHDSDRDRALAWGFDEYVSKPFRTTELLKIVSNVIHASSRPAEV